MSFSVFSTDSVYVNDALDVIANNIFNETGKFFRDKRNFLIDGSTFMMGFLNERNPEFLASINYNRGIDHLIKVQDVYIALEYNIETNQYKIEQMVSKFPSNLNNVQEWFEKNSIPESDDESDQIYILVAGGGNYWFDQRKFENQTLKETNYNDEVLSVYKDIVDDIESDAPFARLNLISGLPGSGKTNLIQALIHDVNDTKKIIVSPSTLEDIQGPSLIRALLNQFDEDKVLFIIEDADEILVKRNKNNFKKIQAVLNLSDGILGKMIDIRIIATTNAKVDDIDDAVKRHGRLSHHLIINQLDLDKCNALYQELTNTKVEHDYQLKYDEPQMLCDVYSDAEKFNRSKKIKNRKKKQK